jgi:hypothetical protein
MVEGYIKVDQVFERWVCLDDFLAAEQFFETLG